MSVLRRILSSAIFVAMALPLALAPLAPSQAGPDGRPPGEALARGALPIPAEATVLTLTGLNFNLTNYMPRLFGGMFARPPYALHEVRYPASLAPRSIDQGVEALDAALHATTGPIIVLAHSQGAQVVSHWLRAHADDPAAPAPDRVVFLLTGNPLRANTGRAIGRREVGGTIGQPTPLTARWTVIDFARRYDGWADWPTDEANHLAVRNAEIGKRTYHTHYDAVRLQDPSHTIWKRGTTTFVLTQEKPPILRTATPGDRDIRAEIEAAYRR